MDTASKTAKKGGVRNIAKTVSGMRSALEKAPANVLLADADFELVFVNAGARALIEALDADIRADLGLTAADLLDGNLQRLVGESCELADEVPDAGGDPVTLESTIGDSTLELTIAPVEGADGKLTGWAATLADLTEVKESDAEAERIRSILHAMPHGIVHADDERIIRYINPAGEADLWRIAEHLHVDVAELIGEPVEALWNGRRSTAGAPDGTGAGGRVVTMGDDTLEFRQTNAPLPGGGSGTVVTWTWLTDELVRQNAIEIEREQEAVRFAELEARTEKVLDAVMNNAHRLGAACTELDGILVKVTASTDSSVAEAHDVSVALAEVRGRVQNLAQDADVMGTVIEKIATHTDEGERTLRQGLRSAQSSSTSIEAIGEVGGALTSAIQGIIAIAHEIKLLALNANIEAIRVGEAGREFAVVANEVKELAKEALGAGDGINAQLAELEQRIRSAGSDIGELQGHLQVGLAANQSVAGLANEKATALSVTRRHVGQADSGVGELIKTMGRLMEAAQALNGVTHEGHRTVGSIAPIAGELDRLVSGFGGTATNQLAGVAGGMIEAPVA